ncbi:isocitrate lyase/PEP mutase family protein [Luteibacter rhizovicinus]|nr:isocitrate lyase/phosphoenolpyruvate mutase family protein [Luteibacter rhizovicinus]
MNETQAERVRQFHEMHAGDTVLVLPNAWDAASARIVEEAGAKAVGTTSAGIAWSHGFSDGEQLPVHDLIAACRRICRVTSVPVTVDIERGYGPTPEDSGELVDALLELGIVGVNIEDGTLRDTSTLTHPSVLSERIVHIKAVAQRRNVPLFINARTDTYCVPSTDRAARFKETVRRALLYVEVGADGIFVPGLADLAEIENLARQIPVPLNIYAGGAGIPAVAELQRAGVRRVSLGCGPLQSVMAHMRRIAHEAIDQGTYEAMTADMLSGSEANGLFR